MGQANRYYTRLIARFPFGPYSEQAQLELAYVEYKLDKRETRPSSSTASIRTYPRAIRTSITPITCKAVINLTRNISFLTRVARTDVSARDLNGPLQSFRRLQRSHPPLSQQHLRRRRQAAHGVPCATNWPSTS